MRSHAGRVGRATLAAAAAIVVATFHAPAAYAQTGAPPLVSRNASDPFVDYCRVNDAGVEKLYMCLYTSSDLNQGGQNKYPMDTTYVYLLDTTRATNPADPANWWDPYSQWGPALRESAYASWAQMEKHQWAPSAFPGPDGRTYLYVPNTTKTELGLRNGDGEMLYVSNIGVSTSTSPYGPFEYKNRISYNGSDAITHYMSDPRVVTTAWNHPGYDPSVVTMTLPPGQTGQQIVDELNGRHGGPATWLLWANGVWENCGSLSIGLLSDDPTTNMSVLYTDPDPAVSEIKINGIGDALGACQGKDHPYLEGPELYDLSQMNLPLPGCNGPTGCRRFMLVFSAKPTNDNRNQVIAWATASNIRGPYTYEGILMDDRNPTPPGDVNTSWTNQGSIWADSQGPGDSIRFFLFYHDDTTTTGNHNRKVHVACLTYDLSDRSFVTATKPAMGPMGAPPDLSACAGTRP